MREKIRINDVLDNKNDLKTCDAKGILIFNSHFKIYLTLKNYLTIALKLNLLTFIKYTIE
jgi:hypothetical protein